MLILNWCEINERAVQKVGKPAVYISNSDADEAVWQFVQNSMRALYGDATPQYYDVITNLDLGGLFFFDTVSEQRAFYRVFEQPITDSSGIYACTYDENGKCLTENT